MVETALVWVGLNALLSVVGAAAFVLHYADAGEFDYLAFGFATVFVGGAVELSTANGYIPESALFDGLVVGCIVVGFVAGGVGVRRQGTGFEVWKGSSR